MEKNKNSVILKNLLPQNLLLAAKEARSITVEFANKHRQVGNPTTLECYCAIGSYILWQIARKKYNIKHLSYCCGAYNEDESYLDYKSFENHCWTKYRNNYIVDITATQFKGITEEIYVTKVVDKRSQYEELCKGVKALTKVNNRWGNQGIRMHKKYLDKQLNNQILAVSAAKLP